MAVKTLEDAKREVSRRYIGRSGIHGVGIRRAGNAICVYYDKGSLGQLAEIRQLAAPYKVIPIKDEAPTFLSKVRSMFVKSRVSRSRG